MYVSYVCTCMHFEKRKTLCSSIGGDQTGIQPSSLNASIGESAIFNCSWINATNIECFINDEYVNKIQNANDYLTYQLYNEGSDKALAIITIELSEDSAGIFNNSNISCQGYNEQNPMINNFSRPRALLRIQGNLQLQMFTHLLLFVQTS